MRLIDANALKQVIEESIAEYGDDYYTGDTIYGMRCVVYYATTDAPIVDAEPVRHGKWIKLDMHAHLADHKCTACDQECYVPTCMGEPMYTYCPNCGARMDDEDGGSC